MRRRTFLHGVVVSALAANHARIWAQSTTPSLLGEGKPSRTAQATANLRAAHQLLDQPKIFDDPLALRIIGVQAEAAVPGQPRTEPDSDVPTVRRRAQPLRGG
jgi:hypothetical protein